MLGQILQFFPAKMSPWDLAAWAQQQKNVWLGKIITH